MIPRETVDASFALKWVLPDEDDRELALEVLERLVKGAVHLVVPDLFPYEVSNGLLMAARRGRLQADDARAAQESIQDLGLDLVRPAQARVYLVASAFALTAYDAAYYVVAEGRVLWTGDEAFASKVSIATSLAAAQAAVAGLTPPTVRV